MITPIPARQFQPPYSRRYDVNAYCDFHSGTQGHSTENYFILRNRLYELIEAGRLKLTNLDTAQATTPNTTATTTGTINMIEEWTEENLLNEINGLWKIEFVSPDFEAKRECIVSDSESDNSSNQEPTGQPRLYTAVGMNYGTTPMRNTSQPLQMEASTYSTTDTMTITRS